MSGARDKKYLDLLEKGNKWDAHLDTNFEIYLRKSSNQSYQHCCKFVLKIFPEEKWDFSATDMYKNETLY